MTRQLTTEDIVPGTVLEFFDDKKILCGVCIENRKQRLAVLTEQNREVSLAAGRVLHVGAQSLNLRHSRDEQVRKLLEIAALRKALAQQVDMEELWTLLEQEQRGFSAEELA
jgi:exoribonuclease II